METKQLTEQQKRIAAAMALIAFMVALVGFTVWRDHTGPARAELGPATSVERVTLEVPSEDNFCWTYHDGTVTVWVEHIDNCAD